MKQNESKPVPDRIFANDKTQEEYCEMNLSSPLEVINRMLEMQKEDLKKRAFIHEGDTFVSNQDVSFSCKGGITRSLTKGQTYTVIRLTDNAPMIRDPRTKVRILYVVAFNEGNIALNASQLKMLMVRKLKPSRRSAK